MKALEEMKVLSPLRICALTKEEIVHRLESFIKACESMDDMKAKETLRKVVPTFADPEEINGK